MQILNSEKLEPKKYSCPVDGCDWRGSRSRPSKHQRSKQPETHSEPSRPPAEPSASTAPPVTARLQGQSVPVCVGPTRSGLLYRGRIPLTENDFSGSRSLLESIRIASSQSETLSTESFISGSNSQNPTYVP